MKTLSVVCVLMATLLGCAAKKPVIQGMRVQKVIIPVECIDSVTCVRLDCTKEWRVAWHCSQVVPEHSEKLDSTH